jgi:serine/threonine protein kinase HipA of HipAB toxin-antitoxin module
LNLYNPDRKFEQKDHNLRNIFKALDSGFRAKKFARAAKERIASYIVLDAVIGNTDRHHENWGLLIERRGEDTFGLIAPSFDHASSLGRELENKRREMLLKERRVGKYSENARGWCVLVRSR